MNARVVMSHADIVAACADRLRAHGVEDFNEGDIVLEVAAEEFIGQRKVIAYRAIVDVNIKPPPYMQKAADARRNAVVVPSIDPTGG